MDGTVQELRDSIKTLNDSLERTWDDAAAKALKYKAEALLALVKAYDILEGVCCCDYEDEDDEPENVVDTVLPEQDCCCRQPVWTDAYGWTGGFYGTL